jgi:glycosyltransferase involved in cell wall biosynthesis
VTEEISIVLLTFNSEKSIERTLRSVSSLSTKLYVVDSFSTDRTVEICEAAGAKVTQRPFANYSDQRNWTIDNFVPHEGWQLHLDADEEMEPDLVAKIRRIDLSAATESGFLIGRKIVFMGKTLRFGGIDKTWHCRLFRAGKGRCEDRLYDQHFVCDGPVRLIDGFMLDHQEDNLAEWTRRHNRWSDMESMEVETASAVEGQVVPDMAGNAIQQKRALKGSYYKLPLFWRAVAYFLYRYVIRLGFLDGARGFIYHALQGLWFRVLVDAKIFELRNSPDKAG